MSDDQAQPGPKPFALRDTSNLTATELLEELNRLQHLNAALIYLERDALWRRWMRP